MSTNVRAAIFDPANGYQGVVPAKENEFFGKVPDDLKETFIQLNAFGIVSLELLDSFQPLIVPKSGFDKQAHIDALRRGIVLLGGDPDKAVAEATAELKGDVGTLSPLCVMWMR